MSEQIDRADDGEDYPYVPNAPIDPGLEDEVDGWAKEETWELGSEASGAAGDYAVGPMYEAVYVKGPIDTGNGDGPLWMVVSELYFVEPCAVEQDVEGTWRKAYDVLAQYHWSLRTDPLGSDTEVWCDYTYDSDLHAEYIWAYDTALALARSLALSDQRFSLNWDGGIPRPGPLPLSAR